MAAASRVLYHIVCGAPPSRDAHILVKLAQDAGWDVCVISTPSGLDFIDRPTLEALTGHPVRTSYKKPNESDVLPAPDAIIVAPATFNTINKWAAGISDTLVLGLLTEGIGKGLPIVALPFINAAQVRHPAFGHSVSFLREMGVLVLYGPDVLEVHHPGTGTSKIKEFPWALTLAQLSGN